MFERNLKYLNDNRILYRRDPINDMPTKQYDWGYHYESGTFECYALFRSKAKITTYKSLKWHLIVLYYLNQEMTHLQFNTLARFVANKSNGYVTFNCPTDIIDKMINIPELNTPDRKTSLEKPPKIIRNLVIKKKLDLNK